MQKSPRAHMERADSNIAARDAAGFCLLGLRQHERHNAVLKLGSDAVLLDLARELESPCVVADIVFDVEWRQSRKGCYGSIAALAAPSRDVRPYLASRH